MIHAEVNLDSLSAASGARLTTFVLTYPRFIHAEFMTHRMLSRNAASSRAIPIEKMVRAVRDNPAMPVFWGANEKGMQANSELTGARRWAAEQTWRAFARISTLEACWLSFLGVHKQLANRWLEPAGHITVVASATDWTNFFWLRTHKAAQPEFQALARAMESAYNASIPQTLPAGAWHRPFVGPEDWNLVEDYLYDREGSDLSEHLFRQRVRELLTQVSVGRVARVSYLTHDGRRDVAKDIELHDRLLAGAKTNEPLHMSPFEHVAYAQETPRQSGNFYGFEQYRKAIPGEGGPTSYA